MSSRSNVTKRACDGCKIRKIRCGGGNPCPACTNARIKCTYIRVQQPRGPQRLRSTTKFLIEQTQRGPEDSPASGEVLETDSALPPSKRHKTERSRIPNNVIAPPLYIYHVRMYPVWPIVDVEEIVSALQQDTKGEDLETYALATAVAAATIAQLRLGQNALPDESTTADTLVSECLRARDSCRYRSKVSLNNVRISFFLHVYYENQESGGSESLLYLREAISLAQMMNLHRETSYSGLSPEEKQIRRRVLWLLFVTERGVSILHKLPVVLKTNIRPPEVDEKDEPQVLPAFLKLLNLFRLFEQSKMFDMIEDEDPDTQSIADNIGMIDEGFLEMLQQKLQDSSVLFDRISDVQKADLCVTRHWMRMILWKLSLKKNLLYSSCQWPTSPSFPVAVAKELLNMVSQLPRPAIEAHGLGMELKLYEIASSLADAVMHLAMLPRAPDWDSESRPSNILSRLHSILSTFRGGGNKTLVDMLYKKMAEAQSRSAPVLPASLRTAQAFSSNSHSTGTEFASNDDVASAEAALMPSVSTDFEHFIAVIESPHTRLDPALQPMQDLHSGQAQACGDHSHAPLNDAAQYTFAGAPLSPPYVAYPACNHDPGYIPEAPPSILDTGATPTLSPSWPAHTSVEMMIGDFISQIPDGQFDNVEGFLSDDFTREFVVSQG